MERSSIENTEFALKTLANTALENEKYFSELDGVVGDGDFGYSLARGFEKILEEWDNLDKSNPGTLLKKTAMIFIGRVGGVSGTIWGTAFMRAGGAIGTKDSITKEDLIVMLRASIAGIKQRGETDLGDKTLLDAFAPAVDSLEESFKDGVDGTAALAKAAAVARERAEATRPMIAKKGRAAYTGERSIGTLDAGAVAVAVLFEALSKAWQK